MKTKINNYTKYRIKIVKIFLVLLWAGYMIWGGLIVFYYPELEKQKEQWYNDNAEYIMNARSKCFSENFPSFVGGCATSICEEEGLVAHDSQVWAVPKVYCAEEHNSSLEEREDFDVCNVQSIACQQLCAQRTTVLNCIEEAGADWKWRENMPD